MNFDIVSNSPEQTIELGRKIGSQLKGGEIIAVCGALGSGKTHLIKGIADGAGARDSREVTSPPTRASRQQMMASGRILKMTANKKAKTRNMTP